MKRRYAWFVDFQRVAHCCEIPRLSTDASRPAEEYRYVECAHEAIYYLRCELFEILIRELVAADAIRCTKPIHSLRSNLTDQSDSLIRVPCSKNDRKALEAYAREADQEIDSIIAAAVKSCLAENKCETLHPVWEFVESHDAIFGPVFERLLNHSSDLDRLAVEARREYRLALESVDVRAAPKLPGGDDAPQLVTLEQSAAIVAEQTNARKVQGQGPA